jgi:hypothetical protein
VLTSVVEITQRSDTSLSQLQPVKISQYSTSLVCKREMNLLVLWSALLFCIREACGSNLSQWTYHRSMCFSWSSYGNATLVLSRHSKFTTINHVAIRLVRREVTRVPLLASPCLSAVESRWPDFHEIWYWEVSLKYVGVFQFRSKSENSNGRASLRNSLNIYRENNVLDRVAENIKRHISCPLHFFRKWFWFSRKQNRLFVLCRFISRDQFWSNLTLTAVSLLVRLACL